MVTIPLAPRTARAIELALGERGEGPLFVAADGRRLDRHGAARIVRRVTRRAGIAKHVSPHAILGAAGATAAGVAWARSSLTVTFGDFPVLDLLAVLAGLPLVAAVGGWLLAGRQPQVIARQPLE